MSQKQVDLAAEFTGLFLELILLSVLIPLIIWTFNYLKYNEIRFIFRVETAKLCNKLTNHMVEFVFGKDRYDKLADIISTPEFRFISNHEYYDQLDNNILLIKKKTIASDFMKSIKEADYKRLKDISESLVQCCEEIDHQIAIMSVIPKMQAKLYKIRVYLNQLVDIFNQLSKRKHDESKEDKSNIGNFVSIERSAEFIRFAILAIDNLTVKDRIKLNKKLRREKTIEQLKTIISIEVLREIISIMIMKTKNVYLKSKYARRLLTDCSVYTDNIL